MKFYETAANQVASQGGGALVYLETQSLGEIFRLRTSYLSYVYGLVVKG